MQYSDKVRKAGLILQKELRDANGEWVTISKLTKLVLLNTGIQKSWVLKQFSENGIFVDDVEFNELEGTVRWKTKE